MPRVFAFLKITKLIKRDIMEDSEELIKITDDEDVAPKTIIRKRRRQEEWEYGDHKYIDDFDINYRPPDYHSKEDIKLFKI
jgi:hypothetical protein